MPSSKLLPRSLRGETAFRWRGGNVSRIESLSDAVFALSLTLLVVALEVPDSSRRLIALFWQFPAFAVCFAFLLWVWYQHFVFHRRFGFEDSATVALNGLLLFFVVFYVFPLKFLASVLLIPQAARGVAGAATADGAAVMTLYSGGFIGLFSVLALMYVRAWSKRDELELDAAERCATWGSLRGHLFSVGVGILSLALALALPRALAWSGLAYFLMGPLHGVNGWLTDREVARAVASAGPESIELDESR